MTIQMLRQVEHSLAAGDPDPRGAARGARAHRPRRRGRPPPARARLAPRIEDACRALDWRHESPVAPVAVVPVASSPRRRRGPAAGGRPARATARAAARERRPGDAACRPSRPPAPRSRARATIPLLGRVVGRCRIEALIGQGRTSRVYRAAHEALGTTVAIKILLPRSADEPRARREVPVRGPRDREDRQRERPQDLRRRHGGDAPLPRDGAPRRRGGARPPQPRGRAST